MSDSSIYAMFHRIVSNRPDGVGYRTKRGGAWVDVTWRETEDTVRRIARSLIALGAKHGDRICILADTRIEWMECDLGITTCGGATVGIYPSSLAEDCAYIIEHCDADIVIVENDDQLRKLTTVRNDIPRVRHFVMIDGADDDAHGVLSWATFLERGSGVPDADLDARIAAIGRDDLASLVYTSGTTGVPKGAMITHGNMLFSSESATGCLQVLDGDSTLLFLPLAHVFARLIAYVSMRNDVTLAFAESIQKVAENLREVRPHYIASVPRIFEKVYDKILAGVHEAGGLKAKLFFWALGVGTRVSRLRQDGKPVPAFLGMKYALATRLVFHKIQAALGGQLRWAVSGAAPLNKTIAEFFHACGILILEGLGMTENTSFTNVNRYDNNKFGTVGPVGPGIEMKLADDGEILFRGPNVMKGYFKNPEATAETIDPDGWLYTGDIGEIDADGFLKITDRKKDLIITAGGKNVAPQRIEQFLKMSRYVSAAMAYGDRRKFITALVTLDPEQAPAWAKAHGLDPDPAHLHERPEIVGLIESEIAAANQKLASYESVKKFRIVPGDFTVESGDLTPTLKLKRKVVTAKYQDLIDRMYAEA